MHGLGHAQNKGVTHLDPWKRAGIADGFVWNSYVSGARERGIEWRATGSKQDGVSGLFLCRLAGEMGSLGNKWKWGSFGWAESGDLGVWGSARLLLPL